MLTGSYKSPLGTIYFNVKKRTVIALFFSDLLIRTDKDLFIDEVHRSLELYFNHNLSDFKLNVCFETGTIFEKQVWNALLKISYGETKTYQDIAIQIRRPKAARAVGQACKKNPISIIVPCHRVIGKDGSMRGYSGITKTPLKQKLLDLESSSRKINH